MRRFWAVVAVAACVSCSAGVPAGEPPTRDSELRAAWQAYSAYCDMCPSAATCCLREADFSPVRYSHVSGRYLRALREHYECRRGDTLIDASVYSDAATRFPEERLHAPLDAHLRWSCERAACAASADIMSAELDRALSAPVAHQPGALVACARPKAQP